MVKNLNFNFAMVYGAKVTWIMGHVFEVKYQSES